MQKKYFPLIGLFLLGLLFAQSGIGQSYQIVQQVVGTAGTIFVGQENSIEFTVGEVAIATLPKPDNTLALTQGFHQHNLLMVNSNSDLVSIKEWGIEVFPNPTKEVLYIQADRVIDELQLQAVILDGKGVPVLNVTNVNEPIRCSELTAGYYLLRLYSPHDQKTAVVPFIKIK